MPVQSFKSYPRYSEEPQKNTKNFIKFQPVFKMHNSDMHISRIIKFSPTSMDPPTGKSLPKINEDLKAILHQPSMGKGARKMKKGALRQLLAKKEAIK